MSRTATRLRSRAATARSGRPARIDPARIVQAAIEIGLSQVTLKQVAERLGVTPPALYRHVRNRDELVQLAAIELAVKRPQAAGGSRHWAEVVRGCALGMQQLFATEPQLICEVMNGSLRADGEMDLVEQFLAALHGHGFSAEDGIRIHHAVAMLAIGAAVSATAMKSGYGGGQSHEKSVRKALSRRARSELPLLRSALPAYLGIDDGQWHALLEMLIQDIARRRGEVLPPGL